MLRVLAVADNTYNWPDDLAAQASSKADVIFCLGDLHKVDVAPLAATGLPVYGVYGNHCTQGYLHDLGAVDVTRGPGFPVGHTSTPFGAVLGVSGAIRYKPHGDILFEQQDYHRALQGAPRAAVVLTHCPPTGCNDDPEDSAHLGIDALADYCIDNRPQYLLHGHVYDVPETSRFGLTTVYYVSGHRFLNVDL